MDIPPADPLVAHLRSCCLRVMGLRPGCGFFVGPQLLITCSHVVGHGVPVGATLELSPWGAGGAAAVVEGSQSGLPLTAEVLANDVAGDLALLRLEAGDYPHVALDGEVRLADPLAAIGFPQEGQRLELDQFTAEFEAEVPFADASGRGPAGVELKFKGGQVRHGFSGGPLLNRRTWRVIGVVAVTRDARSPMGGFAKPLACIESVLFTAGQARPPLDPSWTDAEALQRQPAQGAAPAFSPEQLLQLRQVLQGPDSPGLQERIEALSSQLGKERFAIRLALRQLGAASEEIPDEQLGRRLLESTEAFEGAGKWTPRDLEDPRIAQTLQRGQEALRAEDPDPLAADAAFEQAAELALAKARQAKELEAQAAAAREQSQITAAEAVAQRAQLALARFGYHQAAVWFAKAAQLMPEPRFREACDYRYEAAKALYHQGEELGEKDALLKAIATYREVLKVYDRDRFPLVWAMIQNNLGIALRTLGERETGSRLLEHAVGAYREALKERTRERVPLDWAMTQNNLGNALLSLYERVSVGERLEEAVAAYRESLKEYTRERVPLDWAMTQCNLGNALQALGERESRTEWLEAALAAFRHALKEFSRERVPLSWAATQNNLGNVLQALGERESGTERLEAAVAAYREALKEQTRERVPLDWAMTQSNLGNALQALGGRGSGTERLEEAVAAYREALKERTRERVPLDWAMTQHNMGAALGRLGERESGSEQLEAAVEAFLEALSERTRERMPLDWAMTQHNLGNALRALGKREQGTERLEAAVAAYREALKERTRERVPLDWAMTQNNLGNALRALSERESRTGLLEEAVAAYREALKERTRERVPLDWAMTQNNLGNALRALGERESSSGLPEEAVEAHREARDAFLEAWSVFREAEDNQYDDYFLGKVQAIDGLLGDPQADP